MRALAKATVVIGLVAGTACFDPPAAAVARLAALKAEGAALEQSLDKAEERLLGNQAKVHLWEEMARRHQGVSQVACANQSAHYDQMVALMEKQQEKARRLRRGRAVAAKPENPGGIGGPVPVAPGRKAALKAKVGGRGAGQG